MKIKELRQILKGLPANMDVVVNTGISPDETTQGYIAIPVRKVKKKLVKKGIVQSRPHKDEKAKLVLIIE